jgi:peptide-methionine (S)-S-oxide reductase
MRTSLLSAAYLAVLFAVGLWGVGMARSAGRVVPLPVGTRPGQVGAGTPLTPAPGNELVIFAQGCFWGSEYRFRKVPGVVATAVGYTGGKTRNPTYEEVSDHGTGHAESVLIEFDPKRVSYQQLLDVFWSSHDPTTRDRQGPDAGSQYRSAIFTLNSGQQAAAVASRDAEQKKLVDRITTEIALAGPFWLAEPEHQQWDERHGYESCPLPRHAARKGGS